MYLTYFLRTRAGGNASSADTGTRGHPTPFCLASSPGHPALTPSFQTSSSLCGGTLAVKSDTLYPELCRVDSLCIMTCALYLPASSTAELTMQSFTPVTFSGELEKRGPGGGRRMGEGPGGSVDHVQSSPLSRSLRENISLVAWWCM